MTSDLPDLYSFRYATQGTRGAADCLFETQPEDAEQSFDYFFWLIAGPAPILIDCGLDSRTPANANLRLLHHPGEMLHKVGVDPREINTVILSHLHYDHAGCLDLFPSATFVVQISEVAHCTGPAMSHKCLNRYYRREHIQNVLDASSAGRVLQIDGDYEVRPDVTLHRVPGHTPGQQVVKVGDGQNAVVFASDALHLNINLSRRMPFPIITNLVDSCASFDKLLGLGASQDRIVPGHDPDLKLPYEKFACDGDIVRLCR